MQYTTRSLFGFVAATAVLILFLRLPADFKGLFTVFALMSAGVAGCFYAAFAREVRRAYVVVFTIAWVAAVAAVMLLNPWLRRF